MLSVMVSNKIPIIIPSFLNLMISYANLLLSFFYFKNLTKVALYNVNYKIVFRIWIHKNYNKESISTNGSFSTSYSFLSSFNNIMLIFENCQQLDLNCRLLVSEATSLPTVPNQFSFFVKCHNQHHRLK